MGHLPLPAVGSLVRHVGEDLADIFPDGRLMNDVQGHLMLVSLLIKVVFVGFVR